MTVTVDFQDIGDIGNTGNTDESWGKYYSSYQPMDAEPISLRTDGEVLVSGRFRVLRSRSLREASDERDKFT